MDELLYGQEMSKRESQDAVQSAEQKLDTDLHMREPVLPEAEVPGTAMLKGTLLGGLESSKKDALKQISKAEAADAAKMTALMAEEGENEKQIAELASEGGSAFMDQAEAGRDAAMKKVEAMKAAGASAAALYLSADSDAQVLSGELEKLQNVLPKLQEKGIENTVQYHNTELQVLYAQNAVQKMASSMSLAELEKAP